MGNDFSHLRKEKFLSFVVLGCGVLVAVYLGLALEGDLDARCGPGVSVEDSYGRGFALGGGGEAF